jgi:hypothetical protein
MENEILKVAYAEGSKQAFLDAGYDEKTASYYSEEMSKEARAAGVTRLLRKRVGSSAAPNVRWQHGKEGNRFTPTGERYVAQKIHKTPAEAARGRSPGLSYEELSAEAKKKADKIIARHKGSKKLVESTSSYHK